MTAEARGLAEVVQQLPAPWRGRYFETVDSTQDEARAAARRGAPGRSLFLADYQRAGRGRQGRTWLARPGTSLLMSVLFREAGDNAQPWRFTSLASLALSEAIDALTPSEKKAAIKWPNDVMLDDRKVAGILAETTFDGRELVACVGVGVNVNADERDLAQFPDATSIRISAGHAVARGDLLLAFVGRVDYWLDLHRSTHKLHTAWEARLWRRGQRLRLLDIGDVTDVIVLGASRDGVLHVRLPDGTERQTSTGELLA